MTEARRYGLPALLGAAAALLFLFFAIQPTAADARAFAAVFLCLLAAACVGPFLDRGGAIAFTGAALIVALAGGAGFAALYPALFAATLACMGCVLYRPAVALTALVCLTTYFWWDPVVLFRSTDPRATVLWAHVINPASSAAITLDFDWVHAKALYTNNQTPEMMVGVPLYGLGRCALYTAALALPFAAIAFWKERRA
ncbi:MAG: hypothetical protein AAGD14_18830 [Planctomycetota bacterium]